MPAARSWDGRGMLARRAALGSIHEAGSPYGFDGCRDGVGWRTLTIGRLLYGAGNTDKGRKTKLFHSQRESERASDRPTDQPTDINPTNSRMTQNNKRNQYRFLRWWRHLLVFI